jgi:hypothetical protein
VYPLPGVNVSESTERNPASSKVAGGGVGEASAIG